MLLPPTDDDLAEFLATLITEGQGWLPVPRAEDVSTAAQRLKNVGVLSDRQYFTIVEQTNGIEGLSRLAAAIRRHFVRDTSIPEHAMDPDTLREIVGWTEGGVYKRIDENRELLELLVEEAPEFLNSHSWVRGWLEGHDNFLVELAEASQIHDGLMMPRYRDDPFSAALARLKTATARALLD